MRTIECDVAVIGGGPAGLAAAVAAREEGAAKVLIIERDKSLGGILQQCIHPGFGLKLFNQELTGPEYAGRFIEDAGRLGVESLLEAMVLSVSAEKTITCVSPSLGLVKVAAKAIVLAMGCRERTRGNLGIPGGRPAGIFTAGSAQRLINIQGYMVGRNVVILGSGDIGMIMARRLTLEGSRVAAVVEISPYLTGLTRNRVQCLEDFNIPLLLSHTIVDIKGGNRVEGVTIAAVDPSLQPVPGTEQFLECDTLLLSVGLIPENELSKKTGLALDPVTGGPSVSQRMETSVPGIFACGNVVHVNDLVDNVTLESRVAGKNAARLAHGGQFPVARTLKTVPGDGVRYICPQRIGIGDDLEEVTLFFRVQAPITKARITLSAGGRELASKRLIKANPGEMESVTLSAAQGQQQADDLRIDAVKEE